jgi:hypothetical protein
MGIEETYLQFTDKWQKIEKAIYEEMYASILKGELPDYKENMTAADMREGHYSRLPRNPQHLQTLILLDWQSKTKKPFPISENELLERITRFYMLQGELPFTPENWALVFAAPTLLEGKSVAKEIDAYETHEVELLKNLANLHSIVKNNSWNDFDNHEIMRNPKMPIYAAMLYVHGKITLSEYIDLSQAFHVMKEYAPIYRVIDTIENGKLNPQFIALIKQSLFAQSSLVNKKWEDNLTELLLALPLEQRQIIMVFALITVSDL